MKKSISVFFLPLLFVSQICIAANPFEASRHKLGGALDYWKYEEPGLMQDSGALLGVEYNFRNVAQDVLAYELNAEILLGRTNYKGQDLNSGTPLEFEQTNTMGMLQFFMGPLIDLNGNVYLIPKLGLLYRKLIDQDDAFAGDYQRDQEYTVIPLGLDAVVNAQRIQWIFSVWHSIYFSGKNKTYLTDVGGDQDLSFKQDNGNGTQLSVTMVMDHWYITGMFRYWAVEDSESKEATVPTLSPPTNNFYEPENKTISIGVRAGWAF
jgi:hypothetical protein